VGKACRDWEVGQIQAGVCGSHLLAVRKACDNRFWAGWMLVTWAPVVRKMLLAPESKMAQLLMVSMSMLTMRRSMAVASAYGWVEVGRVCNIVFRFILLLSAAPACQKLLNHS